MMALNHPDSKSVDPREVANFSALADRWWDPYGPFKPLHVLNPARLSYLAEQICMQFGRDVKARHSLDGLSLLDIGCGGGLLSEPMRRLAAEVTGIDASGKNIAVAKIHAGKSGLDIDYQATSAEALAETGRKFDVVISMEVIEHVADIPSFLAAAKALLAQNGILILSTLNRTPKAFLMAIVGAEYILRWLPRGTHDWKKFLTPQELAAQLTAAGLEPGDVTGMHYSPLANRWSVSAQDVDVNYMMTAHHPAA